MRSSEAGPAPDIALIEMLNWLRTGREKLRSLVASSNHEVREAALLEAQSFLEQAIGALSRAMPRVRKD